MSAEPDIWHLPETTVAVAKALDPDAWARLERIETVIGIPPKTELTDGGAPFRRLSYEDWQRRVAWTLDAAPRVIGAYCQANRNNHLRRSATFDVDSDLKPPKLIDP